MATNLFVVVGCVVAALSNISRRYRGVARPGHSWNQNDAKRSVLFPQTSLSHVAEGRIAWPSTSGLSPGRRGAANCAMHRHTHSRIPQLKDVGE